MILYTKCLGFTEIIYLVLLEVLFLLFIANIMNEDEPPALNGSIMDTDITESASVSLILNESQQNEELKKKRKSRKRSDGYKSRKRAKPANKATKSDEYEVEMIIDHKTDEEVKSNK